jgi:hypothetical protein
MNEKQELSKSARKQARKQFPKQPQPWHLFTAEDYSALPTGTVVEPEQA